MAILVTGVTGQLGYDVAKYLNLQHEPYYAPTHEEMDITSEEQVRQYFSNKEITGIIHCAAYTKVDKAEDEPEICYDVNVGGTNIIVRMAKNLDIPLIYISTDYVFNGMGTEPWKPTDKPCPINTYGKTKMEGEEIVISQLTKFFIIRISWVFGSNGNNFVNTMIRLSKERDTISIVNDQFGSPTYTFDLAPKLCEIIKNSDKYGIYHAHNAGVCTWYDFADYVFKTANIKITTIPIRTDQYPTKAKRPYNSVMDSSSFELICGEMPHWKDAVTRFLKC